MIWVVHVQKCAALVCMSARGNSKILQWALERKAPLSMSPVGLLSSKPVRVKM